MLILFQEPVERDIDNSSIKSKIYLTNHLTIFHSEGSDSWIDACASSKMYFAFRKEENTLYLARIYKEIKKYDDEK